MSIYIQTCAGDLEIKSRPAMVIFPGGGYEYCSEREAEPVALAFAAKGYNCFIVRYTCAPDGRYPLQLTEAAAAISIVKDHAQMWNTDKDNIFAIGFSAGGHLCGSVSTLYGESCITSALGISDTYARPTASIMCYPVVTSGEKAHRGSFDNLLGDKSEDKDMLEKVSIDKQVTKNTPPMFIWSTFDDGAVPCENSLMLASALKKNGVPFELHIYGSGHHGLSLAQATVNSNTTEPDSSSIKPRVALWVDNADKWLHETFKLSV